MTRPLRRPLRRRIGDSFRIVAPSYARSDPDGISETRAPGFHADGKPPGAERFLPPVRPEWTPAEAPLHPRPAHACLRKCCHAPLERSRLGRCWSPWVSTWAPQAWTWSAPGGRTPGTRTTESRRFPPEAGRIISARYRLAFRLSLRARPPRAPSHTAIRVRGWTKTSCPRADVIFFS